MKFLKLLKEKFLYIFQQRKNDNGICNCKDKVIELSLIYYHTHAPLKDNRHTTFDIAFCKKCGGISCIPHSNFELYMKEGLDPYRSNFKKIFNITKEYKYCT